MCSAASISRNAGCMASSSCRARAGPARRWSIWVESPHRDQDEAEIAHLVQRPVQGGLIGQRPGNDRLAAVTDEVHVLEPGGPAPIKDPLDADLVARIHLHAGDATKTRGAGRHPKVPTRVESSTATSCTNVPLGPGPARGYG